MELHGVGHDWSNLACMHANYSLLWLCLSVVFLLLFFLQGNCAASSSRIFTLVGFCFQLLSMSLSLCWTPLRQYRLSLVLCLLKCTPPVNNHFCQCPFAQSPPEHQLLFLDFGDSSLPSVSHEIVFLKTSLYFFCTLSRSSPHAKTFDVLYMWFKSQWLWMLLAILSLLVFF